MPKYAWPQPIPIRSIGDRDHERSTQVRAVRAVAPHERKLFDFDPGWHYWGESDGIVYYRTRSIRLGREATAGHDLPRDACELLLAALLRKEPDTIFGSNMLLAKAYATLKSSSIIKRPSRDGIGQVNVETKIPLPKSLIWTAPLPFDEDSAKAASALNCGSAQTCCSVREEHGRWVYETGNGRTLRAHGSADTRQEAEIMATAILWSSWHHRVEQILKARGGSLRWGEPIVAPLSVRLREV